MDGLEFRLEFLIGLLGIVALLAQLARMVGVPYPIFLVLDGIGVGLVPGFPDVVLPPEIIFLVFIPPLLLSAAISSSHESGLEAGRVTDEYQESSAAWSRWRRELFDAECETVVSLRDAGEINADVMRRVERDIDLEELRQSG
jgi:hypothetical protein